MGIPLLQLGELRLRKLKELISGYSADTPWRSEIKTQLLYVKFGKSTTLWSPDRNYKAGTLGIGTNVRAGRMQEWRVQGKACVLAALHRSSERDRHRGL